MILLTGASGFIGGVLANHLIGSGCDFRTLSRGKSTLKSAGVIHHSLDLSENVDLIEVFNGIDTVIHLAGRAHIMKKEDHVSSLDFRTVNSVATIHLAKQAVTSGVKRFIYISSIVVNGNNSSHPFTEEDVPSPHDPYSQSKFEAEIGLRKIAMNSEMELVIIRPPLVYGCNAPGNFGNLIKLLAKPLLLPFGAVNNKRSMVYVENLVDFIICCIDHPSAANQTFLISDCEDVSLKTFITYIRIAMVRRPLLLPVPVSLFKFVGRLFGKMGVVDRLVGDLQVDPTKANTMLNWKPPYSVEQGIQATVDDFIANKNNC